MSRALYSASKTHPPRAKYLSGGVLSLPYNLSNRVFNSGAYQPLVTSDHLRFFIFFPRNLWQSIDFDYNIQPSYLWSSKSSSNTLKYK